MPCSDSANEGVVYHRCQHHLLPSGRSVALHVPMLATTLTNSRHNLNFFVGALEGAAHGSDGRFRFDEARFTLDSTTKSEEGAKATCCQAEAVVASSDFERELSPRLLRIAVCLELRIVPYTYTGSTKRVIDRLFAHARAGRLTVDQLPPLFSRTTLQFFSLFSNAWRFRSRCTRRSV